MQRPLPQPVGQDQPAAGGDETVIDFEGFLDGVAFEGCTLRSTEFSHTPLRGIDLRQSQLGDLRLTVDDLRGAIVAPSQALDLLPLLGVVVRTQTAEETE